MVVSRAGVVVYCLHSCTLQAKFYLAFAVERERVRDSRWRHNMHNGHAILAHDLLAVWTLYHLGIRSLFEIVLFANGAIHS